MKLKNNFVIFVACFIGNTYGFSLEGKFNEVDTARDCHVICSKDYDRNNTDLKEKTCICPHKLNIDGTTSNYSKLAPLKHNLTIEHEGTKGKKVKRQTIQELINKRNKINKKPSKTVTMFDSKKPSTSFKINEQIKKPQIKSRTSLSLQELGGRLKELRTRMSTKPRLEPRGSFSGDEKHKELLKQLNEKREEIIKDLKTLRSKSSLSKDSPLLKERVGSVNHLQNRIDSIGSSIKERMKEKADERKTKNKITSAVKENKEEETVGAVKTQSATTEKSKPTTSAIPEIVLGQTESTGSKTETVIQKVNEKLEKVESSTNKTEAVAGALEKMKEKQKEAVMKLKDKLNLTKNKSKNLEVLNDNNVA